MDTNDIVAFRPHRGFEPLKPSTDPRHQVGPERVYHYEIFPRKEQS